MKIPNRVRLRHIRCFLSVAEHGSVTKAAAALNTVQPALSRTLRELEAELGQPLFERTAKGLVPTQAGETLRRHALTGMSQIERGIQLAGGYEQQHTVSVGMLPNVARTLVPAAVSRFKEIAPDIDVRLYWANVAEIVDRLRQGDIDCMVGRLPSLEHMAGVSFEHLYSEALVFVARRGHPLADVPNLTLNDIDRELVIVPQPNTIIRRELSKFTIGRGMAEFSNKIETVSFEFTRAFLSAQDAVACMPLGAIRQELANGQFVILDIHGEELIGSVGLSYMTGRDLSPAAAQLVEILREEARAYI